MSIKFALEVTGAVSIPGSAVASFRNNACKVLPKPGNTFERRGFSPSIPGGAAKGGRGLYLRKNNGPQQRTGRAARSPNDAKKQYHSPHLGQCSMQYATTVLLVQYVEGQHVQHESRVRIILYVGKPHGAIWYCPNNVLESSTYRRICDTANSYFERAVKHITCIVRDVSFTVRTWYERTGEHASKTIL